MGTVRHVGQRKEFGFYLRCNKKPNGSKQGSDMIKIIFKNQICHIDIRL